MGAEKIKILLVEDEVAHAELIRRAFSRQTGQVNLTVARTLQEARNYLTEFGPELIITDLLLPDGKGSELLSVDKEALSYPIVIMTSHGDEQAAVEAMKAGALDYIVKSEASLSDMPHVAERTLREWGHILEHKRAEEELKQRASQLALINDIGSKIASVLELDAVLDRAARLVQQMPLYHHVALFLINKERLKLRAVAGAYEKYFSSGHTQLLNEGINGWVATHGEKVVANDVSLEPRYISLITDHTRTQSELCLPIKMAGQTVGVLDIQSPHLNVFSENQVMALETVTDQVAVAIENARLYEAVRQELNERKRAEEEIQRRNRELTLLNQVIAASATTSSMEPETVLETACRELALVFGVPQATAALLNEGKTIAVIVAEYLAEGRPPVLNYRIPVAGNLPFQQLMSHKKPLVVPDVRVDLRFAPFHKFMRQRGTVSLLILPLLIEEEVLGSLNLEALEPRHFSTEEVNLAWRVADQVSGALTRVHLDGERRRLEAQYQHSQKMETIGTLAGGIAHDFNNILQAIFGYTEMAQRDATSENKISADLEQVIKAAHRAKDLVQQILTFSRQGEQERKAVYIQLIVKEALKLLRATLPTTIEIRQDIDANCEAVLADPTQIHQVIMNLCTNSYHAMRERGGTLRINLKMADLDGEFVRGHPNLAEGRYLRLTICDTGHGMEPAVMERIFEPFYTTKEVGEGTGLGLAVVHGIVIRHGGEIMVESELGQGTTFQIYLPCVEADTQGERLGLPEEQIPKGQEHILFVDDEEAIALMGKLMLENLGYEVTVNTSSIDALEAFRSHPEKFDLVITDQTMPWMTGIRLAAKLMKIQPDIPIILTSGFSERVTPENIKDYGIREYIMKPYNISDLSRAIRDVLEKH